MKRIAIDVVILPPDPVMDLALTWNRKLCELQPANIVLGKFQYLPHISMVMGCIRADQLSQAQAILQSVAAGHRRLELQVPHIRTVNAPSGKKIISFDISRTEGLASLHESMVNAFQPLLTKDADASTINDLPPVSPDAINWINHYIPDHCFDKFWPHITIGFGDPPFELRPFSFQALRLAICHLGNHCTCSKILAETNLRS
jgi:hypothetical protein